MRGSGGTEEFKDLQLASLFPPLLPVVRCLARTEGGTEAGGRGWACAARMRFSIRHTQFVQRFLCYGVRFTSFAVSLRAEGNAETVLSLLWRGSETHEHLSSVGDILRGEGDIGRNEQRAKEETPNTFLMLMKNCWLRLRMASGADHQQVHVEVKQEAEFSHSFHPFTRHFSQAAHALLTSCTRQEVLGNFATFDPKTQEYLFKIYTLVVAQIRENVIAEFGSICKEHRVLEVLDHVSDRTTTSATEVGDHIQPEKIAKEVAVKRKFQEVDEMRRKLEKAKEENKALAAQLELLRLDMEKTRDQGSVNGLIEKIRSVNMKFFN